MPKFELDPPSDGSSKSGGSQLDPAEFSRRVYDETAPAPGVQPVKYEGLSTGDWNAVFKNSFGYDLSKQPREKQEEMILKLYKYLNGYDPRT